jgi:hypothetical protein
MDAVRANRRLTATPDSGFLLLLPFAEKIPSVKRDIQMRHRNYEKIFAFVDKQLREHTKEFLGRGYVIRSKVILRFCLGYLTKLGFL